MPEKRFFVYGSIITIFVLMFLNTAFAADFEPVSEEDKSLKIESHNVKICESGWSCTAMPINNADTKWSHWITTVSGFPGSEKEKVFRFETKMNSTSKRDPDFMPSRAEVSIRDSVGQGDTMHIKYKVYVPEERPSTGNELIHLGQLHGRGIDNVPIIIGIYKHNLVLHLKGGIIVSDEPIVREAKVLASGKDIYEHWHDIDLKVTWNDDPTLGKFTLKYNGETILDCTCKTQSTNKKFIDRSPEKEKYRFHMGVYRWKLYHARKDPDAKISDYVAYYKDVDIKYTVNGKVKQMYK
jgi:hypothetical protein